jgi:hypothetical protein
MKLDVARAIADAVLMEGYVLYPYRASAPKNRFRWTFGVLAPRAWSEAGGCESSWLEAQVLVAGTPARIAAQLRFVQIERRRLEALDGTPLAKLEFGDLVLEPWDEGIDRSVDVEIATAPSETRFSFPGARSVEERDTGRVVRQRHPLEGVVTTRWEELDAPRPLARLTIRVENTTPWPELAASRGSAIAGAFASTHLLLGVEGAQLLSAIDPPAWASQAAARCKNVRTYPVLAGPPGTGDVALLAPFILYDHPMIAPESAGDLCDATEIDELLMLRTRTLTDDEKRQARATDARAAQIIDRADALPAEQLARMHGNTRDVVDGEMVPRRPKVGDKVRLRTSTRRTDAQDFLYAGHIATVAALREDVDGTTHVAVTIDDDPAAELHDWYGRYHYYRLDEVDLL